MDPSLLQCHNGIFVINLNTKGLAKQYDTTPTARSILQPLKSSSPFDGFIQSIEQKG